MKGRRRCTAAEALRISGIAHPSADAEPHQGCAGAAHCGSFTTCVRRVDVHVIGQSSALRRHFADRGHRTPPAIGRLFLLDPPQKEFAVAKGQKRTSREQKKPKAVKAAAPVPVSSLVSRVNQSTTAPKKKA